MANTPSESHSGRVVIYDAAEIAGCKLSSYDANGQVLVLRHTTLDTKLDIWSPVPRNLLATVDLPSIRDAQMIPNGRIAVIRGDGSLAVLHHPQLAR